LTLINAYIDNIFRYQRSFHAKSLTGGQLKDAAEFTALGSI